MAGGRLIPDGAVIACTACDWSSAELSARHDCPNDPKVLQAKLEQAERALAQARDGAFANIAEAEVIKLANRAAAAESALAAARGAWEKEKHPLIDAAYLLGPEGFTVVAGSPVSRSISARAFAAIEQIDRILSAEPRAAPPAIPLQDRQKDRQNERLSEQEDRQKDRQKESAAELSGKGEPETHEQMEERHRGYIRKARQEAEEAGVYEDEPAEPGEAKKEEGT